MGISAEVGPRAEGRSVVGQLAEEQAALRRVATLVAQGAPSAEVFTAVANEVAHVLQLPNAAVCRCDDEGATLTVMAISDDRPHGFQQPPTGYGNSAATWERPGSTRTRTAARRW